MRLDEFECVLIDIKALMKYNLPSYISLIYKLIVENIESYEGYTSKFLKRPIEADSEFLVKGLVLDFIHGNVLRLSTGGYIYAASHGTNILNDKEIDMIYPGRKWIGTNRFFTDVHAMIKGHMSNKLMVLLSSFEIAVGLVFVRIVDTIDVITRFSMKNYYFVYNSIVIAVQKVLNKFIGYFGKIIKEPQKYINKCETATVSWLSSLKEADKCMVLFSEWSFYYTKQILRFLLGPKWNTIFHAVICDHNKIDFFYKSNTFQRINNFGNQLRFSQFYIKGSWKYLEKFLLQRLNKTDPKVLSIGVDLFLDACLQKMFGEVTVILVCEEVKAETENGLGYAAPFDKILTSKVWGSFFRNNDHPMLLSSLIRRYTTFIVGDITEIANFGLTTEIPFVLLKNKKSA